MAVGAVTVTIVSQHSNPVEGASSLAHRVKVIPNSFTSRSRAILHGTISIQDMSRAVVRGPTSSIDKGKTSSRALPCRGPMIDSLEWQILTHLYMTSMHSMARLNSIASVHSMDSILNMANLNK